jgi:hypothetical protein
MVHLVRDSWSRDVVEFFEHGLQAAQEGLVVGVVAGVALKGRRYIVNTAGTLSRDPTLARGILCAADDELQRMVQGKADTDTTIL